MKKISERGSARDEGDSKKPRIAADDAALCERTDRVGVTAECARRVCARGARWSGRWPGGEPMARFFTEAGRRLRET